jgi:hypothetical protein
MQRQQSRARGPKIISAELKTLARQKVPVKKIAKSLKRTLRATQQKAYLIEACH